MIRTTTARFIFVLAAIAATPALAHVGVGASSGFASGFLHPIFGPDHLFAMISVGLWAGMVGGAALWVWPLAFVGVMVAGGVTGMSGTAMPFVEPAILASVIVLGLAVALAVRAPAWLGAFLVGGFALFHGHAHGTEIPAAVSGIEYLAGFAVATAILHGIGITLAVGAARFALLTRVLGVAAAIAGVALAAA